MNEVWESPAGASRLQPALGPFGCAVVAPPAPAELAIPPAPAPAAAPLAPPDAVAPALAVEPPLLPATEVEPAIEVEPADPVVAGLPPVPAELPPTVVMSGPDELLHASAVNEAESMTPARVR